jgi:type III secretion protein V
VARDLDPLVRRHASDLIGLDDTQRMLDRLETTDPALVRAVVPALVPLRLLVEVAKRLLAEGVNIRPWKQILEALAQDAGATKDAGALVERVRTALARHISFAHARDGVLAVHPLDPVVEDAIRDAIHEAPDGAYLAMAPDEAQDLAAATRALMDAGDGGAVLVTQPDVRRFVRQLLRDDLPEVAVLAYPELASEVRIERRAPLTLGRRRAAE